MITGFIGYASGLGANQEILDWINKTLKNHFERHGNLVQSTIEHLIDYLCSSDGPRKLRRMSVPQAIEKAKTWNKTQQKKGKGIKEEKDDIEIIRRFRDGAKIVKLVGKPAFDREGFLMGHCVASWYGKSDREVYSYRDEKNMPHATFDIVKGGGEILQVKGKGNGPIHPRYIRPIIAFLKAVGMNVKENEMRNLGYYHLDKEMTALVKEFTKKIPPSIRIGGTKYTFAGQA